jgi:hypothetical protein
MARTRVNDWIGSDKNQSPVASSMPRDIALLLHTLRSGSPAQWSQNVFELSRHFVGAVYLAVNTLATHASRSTFTVYERTDDPDVPNGEIPLSWQDPIYRLFEDPNDEDTFADYLYQTTQQVSLTGEALTWVPPNDLNYEPAEFYSLPTVNCVPMPPGYHNGYEYPHGAYRVLPYPFGMMSSPAGTSGQVSAGAIIPAEQIIRLKNHHPQLRASAYATLTGISLQVDTLEAIDQSRGSTMQQGCEQSLALESNSPTAQDPDPEQYKRLRSQLETIYAGPKNAGKIFIPPSQWKLTQVSTVPKDMAWVEGFHQILDFVMSSYGVPKAVAGMQDGLTYATLYASLRAFGYFSLGPLLGRIEARLNKKLVRPSWGRQFGVRISGPEFRDEQLFENQIANDLKCGALKLKEYRALRKYAAIDEPWTNERATASFSPTPAQGGGDGGRINDPESSGAREEDPNVNNARPAVGKRADVIASALERAKINGHAHPIK